jgi:hypothetical protein
MYVNIMRSWVKLFEKCEMVINLQNTVRHLNQDNNSCSVKCWLDPSALSTVPR